MVLGVEMHIELVVGVDHAVLAICYMNVNSIHCLQILSRSERLALKWFGL